MKGAARAVTIGVLLSGTAAASAPPGDAQASSAPAAATPADRFVTVNGLRIHYLDWGNSSASPLILIHGLDRVAHTFDHLVPHFTSRFHVIAIDMRGHGDSGWDGEGHIASYA